MIIGCGASEHVEADIGFFHTIFEMVGVEGEHGDGNTEKSEHIRKVVAGTGMITVITSTVFVILTF